MPPATKRAVRGARSRADDRIARGPGEAFASHLESSFRREQGFAKKDEGNVKTCPQNVESDRTATEKLTSLRFCDNRGTPG
jgi:hypothetical protein